MASPVKGPSPGTMGMARSKSHGNGQTGQYANAASHEFASNLFMHDNDTNDSVLLLHQPDMLSAHSPHSSSTYSYSSMANPSSPDDTSNSGLSYTSFSPAGSFLDPCASSPSNYDIMSSGYSGSTTPGFDTLDEVPLIGDSDDNVVMQDQEAVVARGQSPSTTMAPTSATSSGYPPSPRPTVSPHPNHLSPSAGMSPLVKIEQVSPEGHLIHPSPQSQQASSSSSSSSLNNDNHTIRRDDDGSWRGGVDPETRNITRAADGNEYLPFNLKEQDSYRAKEAKNAEVEEWLKHSEQQLPRQVTNEGGLSVKTSRRRSRSVADFRGPGFTDGKPIAPGESSAGNSGGIEVDDEKKFEGDYDVDDDDNSVGSDWNEGSLDEPLGEDNEKPPSQEALKKAAKEEEEAEQRRRETDPAFEPKASQFYSAHPWTDSSVPTLRGATKNTKNQPGTSNMAIMRFRRNAENIETASRVATFGSNMSKSRRLSAGDADKILPGPLKRFSFGRDKEKDKSPTRKPSISIWGQFGNLKRSFSNGGDKGRSKEGEATKDGEKTGVTPSSPPNLRKRGHSFNSKVGSPGGPFASGKLVSSFRGQGVNIQTNNVGSAFAQMASPLMAAGAGQSSAQAPSPKPKTGNPIGDVVHRVRQSRSKSELQKKHVFGLVSTIVAPALAMTSPEGNDPQPGKIEKKFTFGEDSQKRGAAAAQKLLSPDDANRGETNHDNDEDLDDDCSPLDTTPGGSKMPIPKLVIVPTLDGFAQNVRERTPGLSAKLVDRIAHEQCKRFKKLVDHRQKHLTAMKNNKCNNGAKCRKVLGAVGVGSDAATGISTCKRDPSFDPEAYDSSDENAGDADGNVASAQFPPGVPTPPVARLPAEFECPICFKMKRFNKPSDWTKHVHEDVQPFTCTFPECTEPKSFKRKADWVRHENERHRHLEWWTCTLPDCSHTCYRKDNFVQHLVREHKMPEPKVKAQKAARKGGSTQNGPTQEEINKVWDIVDRCHKETDKHPNSEACRFCGNVCSTWKKLTVHLARHMEAISLPVLDLIRDDVVIPTSNRRNQMQNGAAQRSIPAVQQYPNEASINMNVGPMNTLPSQRLPSKSPDGEYEPDDMTIGGPQLPVNGYHGTIPQYNLTPPQVQHNRSHSVPPSMQTPYDVGAATQSRYPVQQPPASMPMVAPSIAYHNQGGLLGPEYSQFSAQQQPGVNNLYGQTAHSPDPNMYTSQAGVTNGMVPTSMSFQNQQSGVYYSYHASGQAHGPLTDVHSQTMHAVDNRNPIPSNTSGEDYFFTSNYNGGYQ